MIIQLAGRLGKNKQPQNKQTKHRKKYSLFWDRKCEQLVQLVCPHIYQKYLQLCKDKCWYTTIVGMFLH